MDNELLLFDRLNVIKDTIKKYGEENFYLSFCGGKDSTVLHYLLDLAIPNNQIQRVFINTGIEYQMIVDFVKTMVEKDNRIIILQPSQPIKPMLEKYGFPFKSKQHSHNVMVFQHSGIGLSVKRYLGIIESNTKFRCPKSLLYQFTNDFKIKLSDNCCRKLKKEPVKKWEKETSRHIAITGMRNSEGGERASIKGCILTDKQGNIKKFHPLIKVDDEWENWFINEKEIDLCALYNEPYNFKRTGCAGCPFSLALEEQLEIMAVYLPKERAKCEIIWRPVYEEYRRLGYRLKKNEQMKLF